MSDDETIALYDERAADYAASFKSSRPDPRLIRFIAEMPAVAHVLDFGCGPGTSAAHMAKAGLTVDAFDASAEMVALADKHRGVTVWQATFDEFEADQRYDGIWANFSLLHAARETMPTHLAGIFRAVKPGGWFEIALKLGEGARRDDLGRFYTYYTDQEITALLEAAGFEVESRAFGAEKGLDGVMAPWIGLLTRRPA